MGFQEMVAVDRSSVFLHSDFFGETYRIEGKEIPVVLDSDELKARQGGQDLAVAESATFLCPRGGFAAAPSCRAKSQRQRA